MSISMDLRVLAKKLEQNSDELLSKASEKGLKVFDKVVTAIAASSSLLESVADDMDNNAEFSISEQQLDDLAAIATAFDQSNVPALKKQASVLDELLLSIAAPKNSVAKIKQANEDEINRLRENYRAKRREEAYESPKEAQSTFNQKKEIAKAVEQQVKKFVPLEAPLQTRYPPDRPGGHMTRITDHVYQDVLTGIVYDFKQGYTTQKGNVIPGSSVENQNLLLSDYINRGTSVFQTRQGLTGSFANANPDLIKVASVIQSVAKEAPHLLEQAIEYARHEGLSATSIGNIISASVSPEEFNELLIQADYRGKELPSLSDEEFAQIDGDAEELKQGREADEAQLKLLKEEFPESTEEYTKAVKLLTRYTTEMTEKAGFSKDYLQALIESILMELTNAGNMNQFHLNSLYEQFAPWIFKKKSDASINTYNELVSVLKKADYRGEDLPSLSDEEIETAVHSTVLPKSQVNTVQILNDEFPNSAEAFNDTFKLLKLYKDTMTTEAGFSGENLNALLESILLKVSDDNEINPIQLKVLFEEFAPWIFTEGFKYSRKPKSVEKPETEEFIPSEYIVAEPKGTTDPKATTIPAPSSSSLETEVPTITPVNSNEVTKAPTILASITDLDALQSVLKISVAQNPFDKLYGISKDIKDFPSLQQLIEKTPKATEPEKEIVKEPEIKEIPKETSKKKEKITPINNRAAWIFLYHEVKEDLDKTPEEKFQRGLFTLKGKAEEAAKLREQQFNQMMNDRNAVGPYELNSSGFYWIDVAGIDYKEVPTTFEKEEDEDYWETYKLKHNIKLAPEEIVEIELILRDEQNELDSILSHYNIKPMKLHEVNEYVETYKKNLRRYIIDSQLESYGYPKMFGDAQPPNKLKLAEKLETNAIVGRGGGYIAGTPSVKLPEKTKKEEEMKETNVGLSPQRLEALFPELFKSEKDFITPFNDAKGWENAWETAKANAIQTLSSQDPEFKNKLKKRDKEAMSAFYDVVNQSMVAENWVPAYSDEGNPSKNKWYVELNKAKG